MAQGSLSLAQTLALLSAVAGVLAADFGKPVSVSTITKTLAEFEKSMKAAGMLE